MVLENMFGKMGLVLLEDERIITLTALESIPEVMEGSILENGQMAL
jgi:hypothetical protein